MLLSNRSLRSQITLLCTGLILVTVASLLVSYWVRSGDLTQRQIDRRMDRAQNVLEQYLLAKEKLLITAARVLTADFGFKQAVATGDTQTIGSVLANHGDRIDANLMALTNIEGDLLSVSPGGMAQRPEFKKKISELPLRSEHSQFIYFNSDLYQVIILPVRAPRLIAYSIVGFKIDKSSLREMQKLTDLDITILDSSDRVIISTFPDDTPNLKSLFATTAPASLFSRPPYLNKKVSLEHITGINAVLSAKLDSEYRDFDNLLIYSAIMGSIILVCALVFSLLLARRITNPLHHLVELTQLIATGKFNIPSMSRPSAIEFRELNQAFTAMGKQIEHRERKIKLQAERDILTGLYNRYTLLNKIDAVLSQQRQLLLIGINIRGFKQINDTMGPDIGDAVLLSLAARIRLFADRGGESPDCFAGRISSDDFMLVLPAEMLHAVTGLMDTLYEELSQPYDIADFKMDLNLCFAYLCSGKSQSSAKDLLRRVAIAIGEAKQEQVAIRGYQEGEDEEYLYRLMLVEQLKDALERDDGQLFLHFQPKLKLETHRIDKVETLIRWVNREGQFISPEEFISLAEQSGLIIKLTQWVISRALQHLSDWNRQGHSLKLSINVSAQDITHRGFIEYFLKELQVYQISANQVTLEITERDLMENELLAIDRLNQLKAVGFDISVDDYGIGQSSLSKLKQLPVDELKIDKSFIMTLDQSEKDQDIVSSTIALGHKLGMRVVAEGVENAASLHLLENMQCDYIQGFYLSRPIAADEFIPWLNTYAISA